MSVYAAMSAAVSGMKAQSKSLGNISDNLANSQTVGYKRVDTSFSDLVTSSNRRSHAPGGVIATPRYRHGIQGDLTQTQVGTNMAIAGNGFFVVSRATTVSPQGVNFDSNSLFSRRGDFQLDKFGYMVNGGGYYLNGRQVIDQDTLNTSDIMRPMRIQADVMEASATTTIGYSANLPANAAPARNPGTLATADTTIAANIQTTAITFNTAGTGQFRNGDTLSVRFNGTYYEQTVTAAAATGIATPAEVLAAATAVRNAIFAVPANAAALDPASAAADTAGALPVTLTLVGAAANTTFTADNPAVTAGVATVQHMSTQGNTFYESAGSFSGGAITVFNELGTPTDVQMRWLRTGTQNTAPGSANANWVLMYQDPNRGTWNPVDTNPNDATAINPFTFGTDGRAAVPQATIQIGPTAAQSVTLDFAGIGGDTQLTSFFADDISVYRLEQNGYQAGVLSDVFINDFGYVVANYDNGRSRVLFQVPMAVFTAPEELARHDGGSYGRTPESGDPLITTMGASGAGSIIASATENSNVDIADEFIKMIVAQRAYSANSRSVTTADDMLQETIAMKR